MNTFQITVLGVAVAILIIILAVFGVMMAKHKKNLIYPPTSLPCPNYWLRNSDGTCMIPIAPEAPRGMTGQPQYVPVNLGKWDKKTYNEKPLPGLDATGLNVDFNSTAWGTNAGSATCAKRDWANKNKILWDGVSNYNGCK